MCKIPIETIIEANEITMRNGATPKKGVYYPDAIVVSTNYNGAEIRQKIHLSELRAAYSKAYKNIMQNDKNL